MQPSVKKFKRLLPSVKNLNFQNLTKSVCSKFSSDSEFVFGLAKNDQKRPELAKKGQKWPFFKNKDSSDNIALFRRQIASLSHLLSLK